jgi:hypothetical protein
MNTSHALGTRAIAWLLAMAASLLTLAVLSKAQAADLPVQGLAPFQAIEFHGVGELQVEAGAAQSVSVAGPMAAQAQVTFKVKRGTLYVVQTGYPWHAAESGLVVQVGLPQLAALTLKGRGRGQLHGLHGGDTRITLLRQATLKASGTLDHLQVEVDRDSFADLSQVTAGSANVTATEGGSARFRASTPLVTSVFGVASVSNAGTQPLRLMVAGQQGRRP